MIICQEIVSTFWDSNNSRFISCALLLPPVNKAGFFLAVLGTWPMALELGILRFFASKLGILVKGIITPPVGPPYSITAHGLYTFLPCKLVKFSN